MELEGGHTYTVTANFQYNGSGFTPDPGNGGGSGDEIGESEDPDISPTDTTVEVPEVPTTSLPESPEVPGAPAREPESEMAEDKKPLTNVPKTGDMVSLWLARLRYPAPEQPRYLFLVGRNAKMKSNFALLPQKMQETRKSFQKRISGNHTVAAFFLCFD